MPLGASLPPQVFLEHSAALRGLALRLLRDHDAADDAVQDTWLRFVETPPRTFDRVGGWLATVLRRNASNQRRAEQRRSEHEHALKRETHFDERELRDRETTLRAIVEAVSALDEPLRAVVLLRWFEGLPPREIGAKLGLRAQVVSDRLDRAHAKLREKLERQFGSNERMSAMLGLFAGLPRASGTIAAAAGAASVGASSVSWPWIAKLGGAAVVAGSAFVAWRWSLPKSQAESKLASQAKGSAATAKSDLAALVPASSASSRVLVANEDAASIARAWAEPSFEYELEIDVVDARDLPAIGRAVYASPAGCTLNFVGTTDANGRLKLRFRAFEANVELDLGLRGAGEKKLQRTSLSSGASRVSLLAVSAPTADTSTLIPVAQDLNGSDSELFEAIELGDLSESPPMPLFDAPQAERDESGWITFVEPRLVRASGEAVALDDFTESFEAVDLMVEESTSTVASSEEPARSQPSFTLAGHVFDAASRPLEGVPVYARKPGDADWFTVSTSAGGGFAIGGLPPGDYELFAGGGSFGRATTHVTGEQDARVTWDAVLDRGIELVGKLVDLDGAPVANWCIDLAPVDASAGLCDGALTDSRGRFVIPNAPLGALELRGTTRTAFAAPPLLVTSSARAGGDEQTFALRTRAGGVLGSLQLTLVDHELSGAQDHEVRVWRNDSARGVFAEIVRSRRVGESRSTAVRENDFYVGPLLAGTYRVEVLADGCAPVVLDPVVVTGGDDSDLGRIDVAATSRIALTTASSVEARLLRRDRAFELWSDSLVSDKPSTPSARAGDYEVWIGSPARRVARVSVPENGRVELELPQR